MTTEQHEPWHFHDGGGRPHSPASYVEVVLRDGRHMWLHSAVILWPWSKRKKPDDVIRWRFAIAPPPMREALTHAAEWFDEYSHCLLGDDWKVAQERAAYCRRAAGERV